jgi:hypothetical protein
MSTVTNPAEPLCAAMVDNIQVAGYATTPAVYEACAPSRGKARSRSDPGDAYADIAVITKARQRRCSPELRIPDDCGCNDARSTPGPSRRPRSRDLGRYRVQRGLLESPTGPGGSVITFRGSSVICDARCRGLW